MADQSLELEIKWKADRAAIQQANADYDALKAKAQSAFDTAKVEPLPKDLSKPVEDLGKHAEHAGLHVHGLHKLFHALNEVLPGLGTLSQAAFSPMGAAVSGATIGLKMGLEALKEWNEEMRKTEEELAKPLVETLALQREGHVKAAGAAQEHAAKLREASGEEQTFTQRAGEATAALKLMRDQEDALSDALKQSELRHAASANQAGLTSDQQYFAQKLAIEQKYIERKRQLELRAQEEEISVNERLMKGMGTPEELAKKTAAAREAAVKAEVKVGQLGTYQEVSAKAEEAAKALKEFEETHNAQRLMAEGAIATASFGVIPIPDEFLRLDRLQTTARLTEEAKQEWEGRAAPATEAEARAKQALARAEREETDRAEAAHKQEALERAHTVRQETVRQQNALDRERNAAEYLAHYAGTPELVGIQSAAQAAQMATQSGKPMTDAQRQAMAKAYRAANGLADSVTVSDKALMGAFRGMAGNEQAEKHMLVQTQEADAVRHAVDTAKAGGQGTSAAVNQLLQVAGQIAGHAVDVQAAVQLLRTMASNQAEMWRVINQLTAQQESMLNHS